MGLYCVTSPGGAPGASTTALGMALSWPGRVLLAECDPMGRRVLPGFMTDRLAGPPGPGVLGLAMAVQADPTAPVSVQEYVLPMVEDGSVELLHGIRDPRHAPQLAALWGPLAQALVTRDGDVVADLGRIGGVETPLGLLKAADAVVMLLKPTLAQIDAAGPRLESLRDVVGDRVTVALGLVADGTYTASEIERVLKAPVLAELPCSPNEARVLSDGAPPRMTFRTSLLVRSLDGLGRRLRKAVADSGAAGVNGDEASWAAVFAAAGGRR